jgi:hypothetical protein
LKTALSIESDFTLPGVTNEGYINNAGTILFLGVPYLLTIPAIDFSLGANLSPIACMGKELAWDYLTHIPHFMKNRLPHD